MRVSDVCSDSLLAAATRSDDRAPVAGAFSVDGTTGGERASDSSRLGNNCRRHLDPKPTRRVTVGATGSTSFITFEAKHVVTQNLESCAARWSHCRAYVCGLAPPS